MQKSKMFSSKFGFICAPSVGCSGNRGPKASASEERAHGRKKNRDKKRGGYCECCMIKYENIKTVSYNISKSESCQYDIVIVIILVIPHKPKHTTQRKYVFDPPGLTALLYVFYFERLY